MQFKKLYTEDEINDLLQWFKENEDRLPESLLLDKGVFIPNLKKTVRLYYDIARDHFSNPTYSGQIFHLFKIRNLIEGTDQPSAE